MSFRQCTFVLSLMFLAYLWHFYGRPQASENLQSEASLSSPRKEGTRPTRQRRPALQISAGKDENAGVAAEEACWSRIQAQVKETDDYKWRLSAQLDSIVEPWFYRKELVLPERPLQTAPNLFLLGLAKAGMLEGFTTVETNLGQSLDYLIEASKLDPDNSAPLIYASIIAKKAKLIGLSEMYLDMANRRGEKFDSYIKGIAKGILRSVRDPQDYYLGLSMRASLPVPNYSELKTFLKSPESRKFALQMMQDGLKAEQPRDFFVSIEYSVARASLPLEEEFPTLKDLWKKHPPTSESDEIRKILQRTCDISSIQPLISTLVLEAI